MTEALVFEIEPVSRFSGTPIPFRRPKEFAYFSYDENHEYANDDCSLKYFYPPRIGCDLSQGFESFRQFEEDIDGHLDSLLECLLQHERDTGCLQNAAFITWRGMMTKLMACPYDNNGFEMNATNFQETIFIEEDHASKVASRSDERQRRTPPGLPSQELMSFWGYKFEAVSTLSSPWSTTPREHIENREEAVVSNYAQYCSMVSTGIGGMDLVLAGEVDAIWDKKPDDPEDAINWVELKTTATIENERDLIKYERKLMKFWIQSFLLGVPRIIVGMRSRTGILQGIEELKTQEIPADVKRAGRGLWNATVCLNFAAALLSWLRGIIAGEGVWRIRRRYRSSVIEVFRVVPGHSEDVLSESFRSWRADRRHN